MDENKIMNENKAEPEAPAPAPSPITSIVNPIPQVVNKPKNGRPEKWATIDINVLLDFARRGFKVGEIAKLTKTSAANVVQRLRPYADDLGRVEDYEKTRTWKISNVERQLLDKLEATVKKDDSASLSQLAVGFGILFDKGRLASGQSTQNVSLLARLSDQIERDDWEPSKK